MNPRGLTLVETLVALLVACVTMAAAARSSAAVAKGGRANELLERASFIASRELEARLAQGPLGLAAGSSSASIDDRLGTFEIRTLVENGPGENLWHLSVVVIPPRDGARVTLHTLLRRPWWLP